MVCTHTFKGQEDHMICSDCNDHCGIQEEDDLVEEIGHSMVLEALHA